MAINPFFNAELYLAKNPDLVRAGLTTDEQLWNHYEQYGAQESVTTTERAPNSWFDVNYYLAANPDLNAAGLTAADALNHYSTYGINEGREFSPTVSASDFDAESYAAENADVREALGIAEDADLTAENKAQLLSHYLAYGYKEGRDGAGDVFEDLVTSDNVINVNSTYFELPEGGSKDAATGTITNDTFVVTTNVASKTIDGLGGDDTVIFAEDTDTGVDDTAVILKNIENVVVGVGSVEFTSKQLLDNVTLDSEEAAVIANFAANAVAGSDDVLNVVVEEGASLNTNGIETVNLELGTDVESFELQSNKTKGDTFTVNVSGAGQAALDIGNDGSPTVTNFVVDGSASTGGLGAITLGDELANVTNVTVTGSATAANDFTIEWTTADESQNLTVVGGAKDDVFTATAAIDTFTGGKGVNTYTFTVDTAAVRFDAQDEKVETVDTITDFKNGDKLDVGELTLNKFEFATGDLPAGATLNDALDNVDLVGGKVFQWGNDTYVVVEGINFDEATGSVVKLAGVNVDSFLAWDTAVVEA